MWLSTKKIRLHLKYNPLLNIFMFKLSNGHSPQIRQIRELLVRMCRGESHFSQKIGFGECGEFGEYREI